MKCGRLTIGLFFPPPLLLPPEGFRARPPAWLGLALVLPSGTAAPLPPFPAVRFGSSGAALLEGFGGAPSLPALSLPQPIRVGIRVFGGHVRGRQFLAEQWVKQGREALSDLEKLVTQHDDPLLDAFLLRALLRKEAPNSQAVPLLWKQLKNGRFKGRQGWRALTEIESRVSGAKSGELLVRLVQMSPAHCAQLGWIPEASRLKLLPFIEELDERCWSKLIGKPKALGTLRMLRVESELR